MKRLLQLSTPILHVLYLFALSARGFVPLTTKDEYSGLLACEPAFVHISVDSIETLYLLRLLVSNINGILANGISIRGIIQLGQYLRTRGDKVDFIKLESWLRKLHIQRMAQLEGSVLITFFDFEKDEIPFVHRVEKGAYKLTLRSLYYNTQETKDIEFEQTATGFVRTTGGTMRKNLRRSMRYITYAPIETISNFTHKVFRSLSEIEE